MQTLDETITRFIESPSAPNFAALDHFCENLSQKDLKQQINRLNSSYKTENTNNKKENLDITWCLLQLLRKDNQLMLKDVIEILANVLEKSPKNSYAWNLLGLAFFHGATRDDLPNDFARSHLPKGKLGTHLQAYCYAKAIALDQTNANFWHHLGFAFAKGARLDDLPNGFAISHLPKDKSGDHLVAYCYARAIALDQTVAAYWHNLGAAFSKDMTPVNIGVNFATLFFKRARLGDLPNGFARSHLPKDKSGTHLAAYCCAKAIELDQTQAAEWVDLGHAFFNGATCNDLPEGFAISHLLKGKSGDHLAAYCYAKAIELDKTEISYWHLLRTMFTNSEYPPDGPYDLPYGFYLIFYNIMEKLSPTELPDNKYYIGDQNKLMYAIFKHYKALADQHNIDMIEKQSAMKILILLRNKTMSSNAHHHCSSLQSFLGNITNDDKAKIYFYSYLTCTGENQENAFLSLETLAKNNTQAKNALFLIHFLGISAEINTNKADDYFPIYSLFSRMNKKLMSLCDIIEDLLDYQLKFDFDSLLTFIEEKEISQVVKDRLCHIRQRITPDPKLSASDFVDITASESDESKTGEQKDKAIDPTNSNVSETLNESLYPEIANHTPSAPPSIENYNTENYNTETDKTDFSYPDLIDLSGASINHENQEKALAQKIIFPKVPTDEPEILETKKQVSGATPAAEAIMEAVPKTTVKKEKEDEALIQERMDNYNSQISSDQSDNDSEESTALSASSDADAYTQTSMEINGKNPLSFFFSEAPKSSSPEEALNHITESEKKIAELKKALAEEGQNLKSLKVEVLKKQFNKLPSIDPIKCDEKAKKVRGKETFGEDFIPKGPRYLA